MASRWLQAKQAKIKKSNKVARFSDTELETKPVLSVTDRKAPKEWKEIVEAKAKHYDTEHLYTRPVKSSSKIAKELEHLQDVSMDIANRASKEHAKHNPKQVKLVVDKATPKPLRRIVSPSLILSDKAREKKERALTIPEQIFAMMRKNKQLDEVIAKKRSNGVDVENLVKHQSVLQMRIKVLLDHCALNGIDIAG